VDLPEHVMLSVRMTFKLYYMLKDIEPDSNWADSGKCRIEFIVEIPPFFNSVNGRTFKKKLSLSCVFRRICSARAKFSGIGHPLQYNHLDYVESG